ncbi:hypothetical protein FKR81_41525, partial [Lentzea tibetensis]
MLPGKSAGDGKVKRSREEDEFVERVGDLSLSGRGAKRERIENDLTLEIGASGPSPQQYDALVGFARDVVHTALAYHLNSEAVPAVTVSAPVPVARQVQRVLDLAVTSYLPYIQRDVPGDLRLTADRITITTATPFGTVTTVSLPAGTAMTPAPRLAPRSLPQYNTNIEPPSSSSPSSPSNDQFPAQSGSQSAAHAQSADPPLPTKNVEEVQQKFKSGATKAEWLAPLWGILLKNPEPMSVNDVTKSGQLPPKYPISAIRGSLLAMKEAGLVVENGQAGKATLYSPVMPPGVSPAERAALLDWARGLPAVAANTAATVHLTSRPNILRLPDTLRAQLRQNTHNKGDNPLLVSRAFEVLLTAKKPLSQQEVVDRLKERHHFPNTTKKTVVHYLNAMVATSLASSTAVKNSKSVPYYRADIPLPTELLKDLTFQKFIDNLPDANDRDRARQRSQGIDPISQQPTTTAPTTFPVSETLKNALQGSMGKENALRVWSVLLVNDPATNQELGTALSGVVTANETPNYTEWLQRSNMAAVTTKSGNANVYTGTVPQGLETNNDLRNWVAGLPDTMKVKAQNRLDNPSVAAVQQDELPVPPLPSGIIDRIKKDGLSGHRAAQVLGILLRTGTPLTNEIIQARLKSEHNVDVSATSIHSYRSYLGSENMAIIYGKEGGKELYVGCVPESLRNDPGLAEWAAELADVGGRANARARIGGTEPLGAARLLPPLPAVLRDAFGNAGQKRAAAALAVLLSTDKPLSAQDLVGLVQRDYRLGHVVDAIQQNVAELNKVGLLKELDKTRRRRLFTAVVPAGLVEVSAQERDALCEWARGALSGRAQADALARI